MKKLNNKGFTLIELLAVIVILAVVMGIAANSVIGVMNSSRKSGLENGATAVADAFRTKYAEAMFTNTTSNVLGYTSEMADGYNTLTAANFAALNITTDNYRVSAGTATAPKGSFIFVNKAAGTFIACMVATNTGSYYVDGFASNAAKVTGLKSGTTDIKITGTAGDKLMWACSNGTHSWN